MDQFDCDVLIAGGGPTGVTLAVLLARRGVKVFVAEKDAKIYPLPRAAHIDHEGMRILQEAGAAEAVISTCRRASRYEFRNARGEVLLCFEGSDRVGPGGWPGANMIHQPSVEAALRAQLKLPAGYRLSLEGEAQAQQAASKRILLHSTLILLVVTLLLYGCFRSLRLALMVLINIPLALMGGLVLTWWMIGNISIATLVGFIAVGGVAARNGIMMISHYLHLMREEGEAFGWPMVERATQERLVPVLMTALSAGIAIVPLVLAAGEPGKEILHPVAVVIAGGLITSTLLSLIFVPVCYLYVDRFESWIARRFRPKTAPAPAE